MIQLAIKVQLFAISAATIYLTVQFAVSDALIRTHRNVAVKIRR